MERYYSLPRPEITEMIPQECLSVPDIGCGTGAPGRRLKKMGRLEYEAAEFCIMYQNKGSTYYSVHYQGKEKEGA